MKRIFFCRTPFDGRGLTEELSLWNVMSPIDKELSQMHRAGGPRFLRVNGSKGHGQQHIRILGESSTLTRGGLFFFLKTFLPNKDGMLTDFEFCV